MYYLDSLEASYRNGTKRQQALVKVIILAVFAAVCTCTLFLLTATCSATTLEQLGQNVSTQFYAIYDTIGVVLSALAAVAIGICAVKWVFGSDPQTVRQAKQWLLYIVIGIALFWLARAIVEVVKNMVSGTGTGTQG